MCIRTRVYVDIFFYLCRYFRRVKKSFSAQFFRRSVCLPTFIIIFYSSSRRALRHIVGRLLTQCSHYSPDTFSTSPYYIYCRQSIRIIRIRYYQHICTATCIYTNTIYIYTYMPTYIRYTHIQVHTPDYQSKRVCICLLVFHSVLITFFPCPFLYHILQVPISSCACVRIYVYPISLLTSYFKSSEEEENR